MNQPLAKVEIDNVSFEPVEHPSYLPGLAPTDYQLFSKLKKHLRGKIFSSGNVVICVGHQLMGVCIKITVKYF